MPNMPNMAGFGQFGQAPHFVPHAHAQTAPPSSMPHSPRTEFFGGNDGKYFPPPPPPPILPRLWPEPTDAKERENSKLSLKEHVEKLKQRLQELSEKHEL